ncbi:tripartite tricarboxylate transporter substrate binding protein [Paralcaligenes sp. KSB-10]|uniref:Bug family tripartite tricarboxylate transporter substrate binding protein n=1 Tax=Paralcaligenes sp. KSB-10 TaxID=2901142 RepID=UPI001E5D1CA1|nr:tripartite tricarboxylate transporter substrate binding protein [Paralcaligenes sp. KSB-10]UHL63783.1 tripartite tricarboxylate transporter substrate binding protein [Paralcaligenes sp. KSB-10]
MKKQIFQAFAFAAALLAIPAAPSQAAAYPSEPISIVVPFPPGGTTDLVARVLAEKLALQLKQSVIVKNRQGAGGNIGAAEVARAKPDGYTLLLSSAGPLSINQQLYANPGYDPIKDFAPVSLVASVPIMLVSNPKAPFTTLAGLIAYAKAHPGQLSYGSQGSGTTSHLTMELLKLDAGIDLQHIPYRGSAPAAADLIGGQIQVMFDNSPTTLPQVKAGTMRALGVASSHRIPEMKNIPAIAEIVPGFESEAWFGLVAPAGTPAQTVDTLNAAVRRVLADPAVISRFRAVGVNLVGDSPSEFRRFIQAEVGKWGKIIKATGLKLG